jgi:hypothetical protein
MRPGELRLTSPRSWQLVILSLRFRAKISGFLRNGWGCGCGWGQTQRMEDGDGPRGWRMEGGEDEDGDGDEDLGNRFPLA